MFWSAIYKLNMWHKNSRLVTLTGRQYNSDGYVLKKSKSGRDQFEHREIAEKILERPLARGEVVHHINGKRVSSW